MNILVISDYGLYKSYSNSFVHAQAKAFCDLGHNVSVLITTPIGKYCNGLKNRFGKALTVKNVDGVKLNYLRILSFSNIGNKLKINTPLAIFGLKKSQKKVLSGFSPDIILAHTLGTNSELGAYLKKRLNVPLVITTHGSDTVRRFNSGKTAEIKRCAQKATEIVAISSLLKERLLKCGVNRPINIILNGFRIDKVKSTQKCEHSVITVSSLIPQKKTDITIRAFKGVKTVYSDATLTVVGDGPERKRLENLTRELGLTDCVSFTGMLPNEDVLKLLAKHEIFCMPSVNEGFGIVYLEAMASSCFVIGTQGEGIADLIVDGENGCLIRANDVEATACAMLSAFYDKAAMQKTAQMGKKSAVSLTWECNAQKNIDLFKKIIDGEGKTI